MLNRVQSIRVQQLARLSTVCVIALLVGATTTVLGANDAGANQAEPSPVQSYLKHQPTLPEPFSDWNVSVTASDTDENKLIVEFDSPSVEKRITNDVYLPDNYDLSGDASPTLYYLHGTVLPQLDNGTVDKLTSALGLPLLTTDNDPSNLGALVDMIGPGGGAKQSDLTDFGSQTSEADFVVASPDTGNHSFCHTCFWIDGRQDAIPNLPPLTAKTVPAETFLHDEFIPLVEHLFNVRTDAGGRGLTGFSMGGGSAWIQAVRHPDKFSFYAPISGVFDLINDVALREGIVETLGYLRDQGYGLSVTNGDQWERFNPARLVDNLKGSGSTIVVTAGDGCIGLSIMTSAECKQYPVLTNPLAGAVEGLLRINADVYAKPGLESAGIPAKQFRHPGVHGANNAKMYRDHIVPMANQAFSKPPVRSDVFSYESADKEFTIWDYEVSTNHPLPNKFTKLKNAARDGSSYNVNGVGKITITTPAKFSPGTQYEITVSGSDGTDIVTANEDGRIVTRVDLGRSESTASVSIGKN